MKVSIIVPVYNASKFLADTLQDMVDQTLEDIEIICVDDGSTDNSADIIRGFMEQDPRVKLFHQQNLYCGVARNNGMAQSSGEYVIFWDADDRFEPETLELMYEQAKATDADICVCGVDQFDSETGLRIPKDFYLVSSMAGEKQPFNRYDIPEYIFNFTSNVVWNKLFRRSFIDRYQLKFGTGDFSEETMFVQPALYYAERICYVDRKLILYRTFNPEGAVANTSRRKTKYYKDLYNYYNFMKQTGEFDLLEVSILNKLLASLVGDLDENRDYGQFCETYRALKEQVFRDFGMEDKDESVYRSKDKYRKMRFILEREPEEYILFEWQKKKQDSVIKTQKQKNSADKKLKAAQKDSKSKEKHIESLEKKLAEKEKKLEEKDAQLKEKEKQLKEKDKQLKAKEKEITDIRNSYSFRTGKVITWLPGKVKRCIKKLQ